MKPIAVLLVVLIASCAVSSFILKNDLEQKEFNENDMSSSDGKSVKYHQQVYPSDDLKFSIGQVGGIATNDNGDLVVFHRASRRWTFSSFLPGNQFNTLMYGPIKENVLYLLDANTFNKVDSWGANKFYMPHGLTIDFEGNIWLSDVGSHQVFKYNIEKDSNEPLLTLGEKLTSGSDESHFCKPTSIAVSESSGDIYVADGYCNSRVVRFDKSGKYLKQYEDKENPIVVAHSIALIEKLNLICTVSREEGRIVCFDIESGKKLHDIQDSAMKTVYAIKYDPVNEVIQAGTGENKGNDAIGLTFDASKDNFGKLLQKWDAKKSDLADTHDIALSTDGSHIYFGQLNGEINEFIYS